MKMDPRDTMKPTLFEDALYAALSIVVAVFVAHATLSCGAQWDGEELTRIRAITCPSVCAAYADAVDAGVEVTPEDEALIGVCGCQYQ